MTNTKTKVLLTKEQNAALSSYIFHYGAKAAMEQSFHVDSFAAPYDSLNKLSWATVEQAIQFGWGVAVEPTFAPGDIVTTPKGHVIKLLTDLGGKMYRAEVLYSADYSTGVNGRVDVADKGMRKATPSEAFFAKMGRREYDFRDGDVYVDELGEHFEVGFDATKADVLRWFSVGDCLGVIPEGSMVNYRSEAEGGAVE